jgi:hypothetical protein
MRCGKVAILDPLEGVQIALLESTFYRQNNSLLAIKITNHWIVSLEEHAIPTRG